MSNLEPTAETVRDVLADIFGVDINEIGDDFSQQTCRRWTSLQHMTLMVALEEHFGVHLSMADMTTMKSLREIVSTLANYVGAAAA